MEKFYCVRVYPDGSAKDTLRDKEGKDSWVEYNTKYRPGNMLFVNGICVSVGLTDGEKKNKEKIEQVILKELPEKLKKNMDTIGPQIDFFGGMTDRYTGYRPEPDRKSFNLRD
jgi:hypothetical protein